MRIKMGIVLGLLMVLTATGCGGADGDGGIATVGGTPSASSSPGAAGAGDEMDNALRFSQCMRENGVPNFPDPKQDGGGIDLNLPEGTDVNKVKAAEEKCKQYMPNGGEPQKADPQIVEKLRAYSKCMRENGVPDFPDPTDQGLQIDGNKINENDPKVKAAEAKCSKLAPAPPSGEPTGTVKEDG